MLHFYNPFVLKKAVKLKRMTNGIATHLLTINMNMYDLCKFAFVCSLVLHHSGKRGHVFCYLSVSHTIY